MFTCIMFMLNVMEPRKSKIILPLIPPDSGGESILTKKEETKQHSKHNSSFSESVKARTINTTLWIIKKGMRAISIAQLIVWNGALWVFRSIITKNNTNLWQKNLHFMHVHFALHLQCVCTHFSIKSKPFLRSTWTMIMSVSWKLFGN